MKSSLLESNIPENVQENIQRSKVFVSLLWGDPHSISAIEFLQESCISVAVFLLVFPYFFECFLVRFLECSILASLIS
jgi:hypothetical protein